MLWSLVAAVAGFPWAVVVGLEVTVAMFPARTLVVALLPRLLWT
jgi:hypothetical protein